MLLMTDTAGQRDARLRPAYTNLIAQLDNLLGNQQLGDN